MDTWLASFAEAEIEKTAMDQDVVDVLTEAELRALVSAEPIEKTAGPVASAAKQIGLSAGSGAATGAATGAMFSEKGHRREGAGKGALIGAAFGGGTSAGLKGLRAATKSKSLGEAFVGSKPASPLGGLAKGYKELASTGGDFVMTAFRAKRLMKKSPTPEVQAQLKEQVRKLEGFNDRLNSIMDNMEASVSGLKGQESKPFREMLREGVANIKKLSPKDIAGGAAQDALGLGSAIGSFEVIRRSVSKDKDKKAAESAGRSLARIHTEEIEKSAKYHVVASPSGTGSSRMSESEMMRQARRLNAMGKISDDDLTHAQKSPKHQTSFLTSDAFLEPYWKYGDKLKTSSVRPPCLIKSGCDLRGEMEKTAGLIDRGVQAGQKILRSIGGVGLGAERAAVGELKQTARAAGQAVKETRGPMKYQTGTGTARRATDVMQQNPALQNSPAILDHNAALVRTREAAAAHKAARTAYENRALRRGAVVAGGGLGLGVVGGGVAAHQLGKSPESAPMTKGAGLVDRAASGGRKALKWVGGLGDAAKGARNEVADAARRLESHEATIQSASRGLQKRRAARAGYESEEIGRGLSEEAAKQRARSQYARDIFDDKAHLAQMQRGIEQSRAAVPAAEKALDDELLRLGKRRAAAAGIAVPVVAGTAYGAHRLMNRNQQPQPQAGATMPKAASVAAVGRSAGYGGLLGGAFGGLAEMSHAKNKEDRKATLEEVGRGMVRGALVGTGTGAAIRAIPALLRSGVAKRLGSASKELTNAKSALQNAEQQLHWAGFGVKDKKKVDQAADLIRREYAKPLEEQRSTSVLRAEVRDLLRTTSGRPGEFNSFRNTVNTLDRVQKTVSDLEPKVNAMEAALRQIRRVDKASDIIAPAAAAGSGAYAVEREKRKSAAEMDEDTKRRLIAKISLNPPATQKELAEQYNEAKAKVGFTLAKYVAPRAQAKAKAKIDDKAARHKAEIAADRKRDSEAIAAYADTRRHMKAKTGMDDDLKKKLRNFGIGSAMIAIPAAAVLGLTRGKSKKAPKPSQQLFVNPAKDPFASLQKDIGAVNQLVGRGRYKLDAALRSGKIDASEHASRMARLSEFGSNAKRKLNRGDTWRIDTYEDIVTGLGKSKVGAERKPKWSNLSDAQKKDIIRKGGLATGALLATATGVGLGSRALLKRRLPDIAKSTAAKKSFVEGQVALGREVAEAQKDLTAAEARNIARKTRDSIKQDMDAAPKIKNTAELDEFMGFGPAPSYEKVFGAPPEAVKKTDGQVATFAKEKEFDKIMGVDAGKVFGPGTGKAKVKVEDATKGGKVEHVRPPMEKLNSAAKAVSGPSSDLVKGMLIGGGIGVPSSIGTMALGSHMMKKDLDKKHGRQVDFLKKRIADIEKEPEYKALQARKDRELAAKHPGKFDDQEHD